MTNSSSHFWKHKSVFLKILHQSSVPLNITPLYFVSWNIMYFGQRQPTKGKNFEIFECSSQNLLKSSCQFWTVNSIPLQISHHSPVPWKITPLYFLAETLYTLVKSSPLKRKFLRLSSARVNFRQIPYVNFERNSHFLFKFFIIL